MVKPGSNSSMVLIGGISILILLIGRMPFREIALIIASGVAALGICMGLNLASDGRIFRNMRFEELLRRFEVDYSIERLIDIENNPELGKKCKEWYDVRDEIRQPYSARIAIHEGGLFGKLSGNSTQKYVVAHIYSDYMFSFIVEEYGLFGGIIILMLFVSLLARGSFIAKLCQNDFAKYAVGGLSLLISGQAFLHIFVNVDIGPMTGQTLPMISDGSFAFLMFCVAFGIILSISKMARNQIREQEEAAAPLYASTKDDIQAAMDVLEQIDNQ
jgi:cell division protein FtsW